MIWWIFIPYVLLLAYATTAEIRARKIARQPLADDGRKGDGK